MNHSPEQFANLEVLTDSGTDAYIHAVNRTFSEGTVIVPGVKHNPERKVGSDGELAAFGYGHVDVREHDGQNVQSRLKAGEEIVWYEIEANEHPMRHESKIGQFTMFMSQDGKPRVRSRQVTRTVHYGMAQPQYQLAKIQIDGTDISTAWTEKERRNYEALFITWTADLKALLDKKLTDKPDLSDRIATYLRDMPADPASNLGQSRILGRLGLGRR
jgi:hypothetical protein